MDFSFTKEQEDFRQEVRQFLQREVELTEKVRGEAEHYGEATQEFLRKAGAKGYLTPSWPKEYGGLQKSHMYKYIVSEDLSYAIGLISVGIGVSMAGPIILMVGTEQQKKKFLPEIARGEVEWSLGYTEPQAGSDLAALEMVIII